MTDKISSIVLKRKTPLGWFIGFGMAFVVYLILRKHYAWFISFGVAFVIGRAMHLTLSVLAARGDRELLTAVLRIAPIGMIGALLILCAAFVPAAWRPPMWLPVSNRSLEI